MATYTGVDGIVKVKPAASGSLNTIAELKGWSIDESAEIIDATLLTSTSKINKAGSKSWTASADLFWASDDDATGQDLLAVGSELTVTFYPEGNSTGDVIYAGNALIDSVSRSAGTDAMIEMSVSMTGTGALAPSTA